MTELPIPDESVHAYLVAADRIKEGRSPSKTIDAIARPVLIAYLREKAQRHSNVSGDLLAEWIEELEAGGS